MDSFFSSTNHNFTLDDESSDNLSLKMNRSRLLLSEMGVDSAPDSSARHMLSSTSRPSIGSSSLFRKSLISTESPLFNRQQKAHLTPTNHKQQQHHLNEGSQQSNNTSGNNSSGVYAQFKLESNKFIDEEANLAELLNSYSLICAENVDFLNEKIQQLKLNRNKQDQLNSTQIEQEDLEKEKHLWNLLHILYLDEQETQEMRGIEDDDEGTELLEQDKENNNNIGVNELYLEERLLRKQPLMRRIKLIVEWLERIASESKQSTVVRQKIGEFSEKCTGWEHTLHYLKHSNSSFNKKERPNNYPQSNRDFVYEMDPDAPVREGKSLHDLDQEDEYKLTEYIYSFVRSGELNAARDFCFKIGQSWRAATLEGFKLFNDRNFFSTAEQLQQQQDDDDENNFTMMPSNNQVFLNEGNFNRDIWRLMIQRLIKDENFSPYEKAAYASLAGFVSPVLPVCRSYMDFIWTYFKALYHHILDKEIRQQMSSLRDFSNTPYDNDEDYFFTGINKTSSLASLPTIAQIFDRIKILINNSGVGSFATSNVVDKSLNTGVGGSALSIPNQLVNNLKTDSQSPFSIILKHIILSGIDGFRSGTSEMLDYLKTVITTNRQNGLLLRFSSHLALFYRSASFRLKNETFIEINENYVQYLVENNYKEIVAYYLSQLPNEIQIKRYSKFLQGITDNKERQHLLKLAKERNMNIQAITLNIVDNLSRRSLNTGSSVSAAVNATVTAETSIANTTSCLSTTAAIAKTTQQLFNKKTNQILTEEDKTKINAIDWIVYDPLQRFKLLEYANLTMRYFLLQRQNFEATYATYSKIPQDTLNCIMQQYNFNSSSLSQQGFNVESNIQNMIENLPLNVTNTIKEYIGFKEYIEAVNIYNDWFEYFHREKPVKPLPKFDIDLAQQNQPAANGIDQSNVFAERIAYDYQLKQYEDLLARWNSKAKIYCDKAKVKFTSLLKFPFRGWMMDVKPFETDDNISDDEDEEEEDDDVEEENDEGSDSEMRIDHETDGDSVMLPAKSVRKKTTINETKKRRAQLKSLRQLYLPNVCFVLVDMFSKMKLSKDLIRVSDLIASEQYKLYALFDAKQLKCFLNKVSDASITLLDEAEDFLGY